MGFLDVIESLGTGLYTVTRRPKGTWTSGVYTPASSSTFTIKAIVEPAVNFRGLIGGAELRHPDEGQVIFDTQVLYTGTELHTRTDDNDPDIVDIDGDTWQCIRVEKWDLAGQVHYRVIVTRQTDGAS